MHRLRRRQVHDELRRFFINFMFNLSGELGEHDHNL
jgi:hypothetical protein